VSLIASGSSRLPSTTIAAGTGDKSHRICTNGRTPSQQVGYRLDPTMACAYRFLPVILQNQRLCGMTKIYDLV